MEVIIKLFQVVISLSVVYVWTIRYNNVVKEFKEFGLSDLTRNTVGAIKNSLATLLITGLWYPSLVFIPSILMGILMIGAQYYHYTIKNSLIKHLPSMVLLLMCITLALYYFP